MSSRAEALSHYSPAVIASQPKEERTSPVYNPVPRYHYVYEEFDPRVFSDNSGNFEFINDPDVMKEEALDRLMMGLEILDQSGIYDVLSGFNREVLEGKALITKSGFISPAISLTKHEITRLDSFAILSLVWRNERVNSNGEHDNLRYGIGILDAEKAGRVIDWTNGKNCPDDIEMFRKFDILKPEWTYSLTSPESSPDIKAVPVVGQGTILQEGYKGLREWVERKVTADLDEAIYQNKFINIAPVGTDFSSCGFIFQREKKAA